jgi:hypothetical protein
MKKSKIARVLSAIAFTIALGFSCSNEDDGPSLLDSSQEIEIAMQWYNQQTRELTTARGRGRVKPLWENTKIKRFDDDGLALLVPTEQFVLDNSAIGFFRGFVFTIKKGEVSEAVIVEFYASSSVIGSDSDKLLEDYCTPNLNGFTGSIIIYDVDYSKSKGFLYQSGENTGNKVALGDPKEKEKENDGGRTQTCWDVYLITFYSDGSEEYMYLYSYCDSAQSGYEPGGGGSSGTSTTTTNGNTKIITESNGQVTIKEYKCLGYQQCGWVTVAIIVPTATVVAEPNRYSFLPSNPSNNQTVFSSLVDFAYQYDGSESKWVGEPTVVVPGIDSAKRITNMSRYLDCFNEWYNARLTIYVDQPVSGSDQCSVGDISNTNVDVGHTFIGIQQNDNVKILGFYPEYKATPFNKLMPGTAATDEGHDYEVAVSVDITGTELMELVTFLINNSNHLYHLDQFNCSNFAVQAFLEAGVTLPEAPSTWLLGPSFLNPGICPGKLGEVLRNFSDPSRNSSVNTPPFGGVAPNNYRQCNTDYEEN